MRPQRASAPAQSTVSRAESGGRDGGAGTGSPGAAGAAAAAAAAVVPPTQHPPPKSKPPTPSARTRAASLLARATSRNVVRAMSSIGRCPHVNGSSSEPEISAMPKNSRQTKT